MQNIFEQGFFDLFSGVRLDEARGSIPIYHSEYSSRRTTVFISHKHYDLKDLKGLLGFLEILYNVKVYIDSNDPTMPKVTSAKTAENIKERIKQCDKFILLATNAAVESKWCNWELGYGDANKYKDHIAIFPLKPKGTIDGKYSGNEYLDLYPHIAYYYGYETYSNGSFIKKGFYVCETLNGRDCITPLNDWLNKK
jgi:hypothetical protein